MDLFSRKEREYVADISKKLFNSIKDIDNLSILGLDPARKLLEAENIKVGDNRNFILSKKSGDILQVKDKLANKLSELFYSELFMFGIVDNRKKLSMDVIVYLFSTHETKPDVERISLSDLSIS